MTLRGGDTFVIPDPGDDPDEIWVIASDPDLDNDVVMFKLETNNPRRDQACVIRRGEHPEITKDVAVSYEF